MLIYSPWGPVRIEDRATAHGPAQPKPLQLICYSAKRKIMPVTKGIINNCCLVNVISGQRDVLMK